MGNVNRPPYRYTGVTHWALPAPLVKGFAHGPYQGPYRRTKTLYSWVLALCARCFSLQAIPKSWKPCLNQPVGVQRFACRVILQSWNLKHNDLLSRTHIPSHPRSSSWLLNCGSCLQNSCQSLFCSQCLHSSFRSDQDVTIPLRSASHPF